MEATAEKINAYFESVLELLKSCESKETDPLEYVIDMRKRFKQSEIYKIIGIIEKIIEFI